MGNKKTGKESIVTGGTGREIAGSDLTDEVLQKSEFQYKSLFEYASDSIFIIDPATGRFLDCNKTAAKRLGYTKEEILHRNVFDINSSGNHANIKERFSIQMSGEGITFETFHVRKDGSPMPVEISSRIIEYEGQKVLLALARDVTKRKQAEETLRKKTAQLNAIIESIPFDVFGIDSEGHYFIQNSSLRKNWGNVIGKKLSDFAPDEKTVTLWQENNRRAFSGETVKGEIEFSMPDGEKKCFYNIITPIYEGKAICGALGVNIDISTRKHIEEELLNHRNHLELLVKDKTSELTSAIELLQDEIVERRKTEEALRQSEKRYRELVNYMSSGVAVFESVEKGSDFIFKDFNQAAEKIDKIKREDLIGKSVTEVFPGMRESGLFEVFHRVWKTGKSEHHPVSMYRDKRISGWRDNYVYKLPSGEIVTVYDDVTEQVKSAERESELLRELKNIFDNFPVGIIYLDNNFGIISTNRFFNDFAGFDEGELSGKLCYEEVGEFTDDSSKKGLKKVCTFCKKDECAELKKPVIIERPLKDKFVRVTTIPELDEKGNIHRFMEIVEDITERKLAEAEAIRASHLAALGELAAGVAHEINNPINGIINYSQLLANKYKKGSREHDITTRIIKESDRIANIISNLLSFARDRREDKHPVHIHDIMSETFALIETQLEKDGIKLILDIPTKIPIINAQPQQIEQVFLNIISNARYALNQKYPGVHKDKILEIHCNKTSITKNPYIRVTFYDRGTGIPSAIHKKIINPFFSTKTGNQGTGLGLSISHGIISDHGGKLSISSVEGEFTRVTIDLPVEKKVEKNVK
jgi:PAS domain S-box-containing protein